MNACDLSFPSYNAAAHQSQIRWALFAHPDVREVMLTPHADTLRVLHRGPVDPAAWATTLAAAGFPSPQVAEAWSGLRATGSV